MEFKEIIYALRRKAGMTQDEIAQKLYVTRQAVSRWESGETVPNIETLAELSRLFDVSINTLLGSPRKLVCQCCGMPLEDESMSRETDGSYNEAYCKWCYANGKFIYANLEELVEFLTAHMATAEWPADQVCEYLMKKLPLLDHWKDVKKDNDGRN